MSSGNRFYTQAEIDQITQTARSQGFEQGLSFSIQCNTVKEHALAAFQARCPPGIDVDRLHLSKLERSKGMTGACTWHLFLRTSAAARRTDADIQDVVNSFKRSYPVGTKFIMGGRIEENILLKFGINGCNCEKERSFHKFGLGGQISPLRFQNIYFDDRYVA